ncbi:MAG: hypothetical protein AABZ29_05550 [Gemmatimonadota bacterium]
MGDELGRTQQGNNNAYAQDNARSWLDWDLADRDLAAFAAALIAARRRHRALRDDRWLTGTPDGELALRDVEWRRPDGHPLSYADWTSGSVRTLVAALASRGGARADRVVVAIHGGARDLPLRLPEPRDGFAWHHVIDTARETPAIEPPEPVTLRHLTLSARSVSLVVELATAGAADAARANHHASRSESLGSAHTAPPTSALPST